MKPSHDLNEREDGRARYRSLLEASPDAMVVVSPNGEIVFLNDRAEKQFSCRHDEFLRQDVSSIIPDGFAERLRAGANAEPPQSFELTHLMRLGEAEIHLAKAPTVEVQELMNEEISRRTVSHG
jgi:PAS domain-containing protein